METFTKKENLNEKDISVKEKSDKIVIDNICISNYWKKQAELIQLQNFKL